MRQFPKRTRSLACMALTGLLCGMAAHATEPEDELKSAIVLSFLRYSELPHSATVDTSLTVAAIGRPGLVRVLHKALDGKLVNNRSVRVIELKSASDPAGYQVLYVATDKPAMVQQALAAAKSSHALTIGETDRFLEYGGSVNLMLVDDHMSFEVSLQALTAAGIEISSKLLRYGQIKGRVP